MFNMKRTIYIYNEEKNMGNCLDVLYAIGKNMATIMYKGHEKERTVLEIKATDKEWTKFTDEIRKHCHATVEILGYKYERFNKGNLRGIALEIH